MLLCCGDARESLILALTTEHVLPLRLSAVSPVSRETKADIKEHESSLGPSSINGRVGPKIRPPAGLRSVLGPCSCYLPPQPPFLGRALFTDREASQWYLFLSPRAGSAWRRLQ